MYPPRLGIILLILLWIGLAGVSPSFAQQRRVFTNDDFPAAAPPPAAPAPSAAPAASAEGTPAAEGVPSGVKEPQPDPNLPPILSVSNSLQSALQRFNTEVVAEFEGETDPARQEQLQAMMDLTRQMIVQNQAFIGELQARQAQKEGEAASQAGAPPAQ